MKAFKKMLRLLVRGSGGGNFKSAVAFQLIIWPCQLVKLTLPVYQIRMGNNPCLQYTSKLCMTLWR